jgi:excisionase family DNA binding protein
MPDDVKVLTVDEVAQLLRVHRNTVYDCVNDGTIPALRLGRRIVVPRERLEALIAGAA